MEFELEYKLNEFREVQEQYFDEDGKCYTGINLSPNIMESMLKLIDELSERVNVLEPLIKQQIKKSNPHPEDYCQECKGKNPTWSAPRKLWTYLYPNEGIVCPNCFQKAAEKEGIPIIFKAEIITKR